MDQHHAASVAAVVVVAEAADVRADSRVARVPAAVAAMAVREAASLAASRA